MFAPQKDFKFWKMDKPPSLIGTQFGPKGRWDFGRQNWRWSEQNHIGIQWNGPSQPNLKNLTIMMTKLNAKQA